MQAKAGSPEIEGPFMVGGIPMYRYKDPLPGHKYISLNDYYRKHGIKNPLSNNIKKVYKYDLYGNYIDEYESISKASIGMGFKNTWSLGYYILKKKAYKGFKFSLYPLKHLKP